MAINHRIIRTTFTENSTLGHWAIDGEHQCFTLEDRDREPLPWREATAVSEWKVDGDTAIPRGRYKLVVDDSARFKRQMPHLLAVPGFEGVRVHWGNRPEDTEGCIIVGLRRGRDSVMESRVAFDLLFKKILALGDNQWLTIS